MILILILILILFQRLKANKSLVAANPMIFALKIKKFLRSDNFAQWIDKFDTLLLFFIIPEGIRTQ